MSHNNYIKKIASLIIASQMFTGQVFAENTFNLARDLAQNRKIKSQQKANQKKKSEEKPAEVIVKEEVKKEEKLWTAVFSTGFSQGFAKDTNLRFNLAADVNYEIYTNYKLGGVIEYAHVFTPEEDIDNNNAFEDPMIYLSNSKLYSSKTHKFNFGARLKAVFPGSNVSKKESLQNAFGFRLNAAKGFGDASLEYRGEFTLFNYKYKTKDNAGTAFNSIYGISNSLRFGYQFTKKFSTLLIGSVYSGKSYSGLFTNTYSVTLVGTYGITDSTFFNLSYAAKDRFDSRNSFLDDDNSLLAVSFDFLF